MKRFPSNPLLLTWFSSVILLCFVKFYQFFCPLISFYILEWTWISLFQQCFDTQIWLRGTSYGINFNINFDSSKIHFVKNFSFFHENLKNPWLFVIHHNLFLFLLVSEMELLRQTGSLNRLYVFLQPPLCLSLLLLSSHLLFSFSSNLSFPAAVTRCTNDKSTGLSVYCSFCVFTFMLSLIYYCEFV